MVFSLNSRMDRRRRALRDAAAGESAAMTFERASDRKQLENQNSAVAGTGKRGAGYSVDVRAACGVRFVQLIPVRRRSFLTIIAASVTVVAGLLIAHYQVYVSGHWPWYGHPLALALDAAHPHSIAAWLGSHLWLLCLFCTTLTFQIRRHKLDDYNGEYRLWFWLVPTCILGSIDSTTHVSELFGLALDRWTQLNIGWSGKAVMQSTLAVFVGVLGLRLCSELKRVPLSLVCWLFGLIAWAGCVALAQERFKTDTILSLQMRIWLGSALWLGGLTLVWIASLAYLRQTYIDAQYRFLLRSRLAKVKNVQPFKERLKLVLPTRLFRRSEDTHAAAPTNRRTASATSESSRSSGAAGGGLVSSAATSAPGSTTQRPAPLSLEARKRATEVRPTENGNSSVAQKSPSKQPAGASANSKSNGWRFKIWPGATPTPEDAPEYRKIRAHDTEGALDASNSSDRQQIKAEKQAAKLVLRAEQQAAREAKRQARKQAGGSRKRWWLLPVTATAAILSKVKMPSLSGFTLPPPASDDTSGPPTAGATKGHGGLRAVGTERPLPGTSHGDRDDEEDLDSDRYLSKAERRRQRKHGRAA
ncbi:MAG: hypothetical protein KF752_19505 [Pirellulaceae bacterium]|nr:hypothetical protein [Pirellulaceae bacterium]